MVGNLTSNTSALIRAQVYSDFILDEMKDDLLPEIFHRDVTDFGDGTTLNIPTFGEVVLRDVEEDKDIPVDAVDSGSITLSITEHVGTGVAMSDVLKEDSYKAAQFDATFVPKQLRAIQERYETDLLAQANKQTLANPNAINGYAHRFVASGTNDVITLEDFIYAKLSLDKANAPQMGRVAVFDGLAEATLNGLTNLVNVSNNPRFEGMVETGFGKEMRFFKNIYGFDVFLSNYLPRVGAETVDTTGITVPAPSGNGAVTSGIVCQFMSIADDSVVPYMGAWRRMPRTEGVREANKGGGRDVFYTTARWGFGLQRPQSLVSCIISDTNY